MSKKKIYALYRGDEFLEMGTAEFLAKFLGVQLRTIYFLASPVNLRRIEKRGESKNALICVRVGLEDEEA